jgi:carotenoid 1,2-hydratase
VFSPYYRRAFARDGAAVNAEDHCAINVALYGAAGQRWTMTERGQRSLVRDASRFAVGPSGLHWDGRCLTVEIDEVAVPIPRRVRGRVRLWPKGLCTFQTALDAAGRHRWGPIAPCARAEVQLDAPRTRWSGHAYLDSNEGDEPIERAFTEWDWSRAELRDGSTAVIYDVRPAHGAERVIAQRFASDGSATAFEPPPRPAGGWRARCAATPAWRQWCCRPSKTRRFTPVPSWKAACWANAWCPCTKH